MKKKKKQNLFPLLAMLLLAMGLASAQIGQQAVKARIPFDFTAGNKALPAGQYRVAAISALGTLSVIGGGSELAMVNSHAVQANAAPTSTKHIFRCYGDQYFLYQVWVQGESRGRELPQTKVEKELASNARSSTVAVLAYE
jgi:hypothetical protein